MHIFYKVTAQIFRMKCYNPALYFTYITAINSLLPCRHFSFTLNKHNPAITELHSMQDVFSLHYEYILSG